MSKISYHRWEIADNTVRAYGGKEKEYRHNIPFNDFSIIVKKIENMCTKEGTVSRLDILNSMHNAKLLGGRVFKKNLMDTK